MTKFHTVHQCLHCRYHDTGRVHKGIFFKYVIMCGATNRYILLTKDMIETGDFQMPNYCPLHDMKNPPSDIEVTNNDALPRSDDGTKK